MIYSEFFQSIDWTPLDQGEIMNFRAPHLPGWEVVKSGTQYEATFRSRFAPDEPDFTSNTVEEMARFLFGKKAYLDEHSTR